jgi:hypothetical protein
VKYCIEDVGGEIGVCGRCGGRLLEIRMVVR